MPHGIGFAIWIAIVGAACFFGGLGILAQIRENRAIKRHWRERDAYHRRMGTWKQNGR